MSRHTPGEWRLQENDTDIADPKDLVLYSPERDAALALIYRDNDEDAANARLMVAAPEMFNAIGELRALFTDRTKGFQIGGSEETLKEVKVIFEKLEMAWRKAEGQA